VDTVLFYFEHDDDIGCEGILPDLISNVMEEYQESKCIVVQNAEEAGDF
jgi:hypothetical protein